MCLKINLKINKKQTNEALMNERLQVYFDIYVYLYMSVINSSHAIVYGIIKINGRGCNTNVMIFN